MFVLGSIDFECMWVLKYMVRRRGRGKNGMPEKCSVLYNNDKRKEHQEGTEMKDLLC